MITIINNKHRTNYTVQLTLAEVREYHAGKHAHQGDPGWADHFVIGRKRSDQYGPWRWHWNKPNDRLSRAVSAFFKLRRDSMEGEEADRHFDGGEWSGPAHGRMWEENVEALARRFGFFSFDDFHRAVSERTTGKWAYFNLN